MIEIEANGYVRHTNDGESVEIGWGELTWLFGEETPGAEQTFGIVKIKPGQRNSLHSHPNCEEILYVISGECEHKLGEDIVRLTPGAAIRIPRGIEHWARCTSRDPLVAAISFSAADRRVDELE